MKRPLLGPLVPLLCPLCLLEMVEIVDHDGVSHGFFCDLCDALTITEIMEGKRS